MGGAVRKVKGKAGDGREGAPLPSSSAPPPSGRISAPGYFALGPVGTPPAPPQRPSASVGPPRAGLPRSTYAGVSAGGRVWFQRTRPRYVETGGLGVPWRSNTDIPRVCSYSTVYEPACGASPPTASGRAAAPSPASGGKGGGDDGAERRGKKGGREREQGFRGSPPRCTRALRRRPSGR